MRKIILILVIALITCCTSKTNGVNTNTTEEEPIENFLVKTEWLCNPTDSDMAFIPIDTTQGFNYGFHIQFIDSTKYINFYTAWCGNDCFTNIYGQYKLLTDSTILLTRDSITYNGDCTQPTKYVNIKSKYIIHPQEKGGFILKKIEL